MANVKGAIDLEAGAEPAAHQALTAFLVVIGEDGQISFQPDVNYPLVLQRFPHPDEVQAAALVVADNIAVQKTAATVQQAMAVLGRQAAASQEAAEIQARLFADPKRRR